MAWLRIGVVSIVLFALGAPSGHAQSPASLTVRWAVSPPRGTNHTEFTFAAIVTGGSPPYRYLWNFGDGAPDEPTIPEPRHLFYRPGTYRVALTVTDAAGAGAADARGFTVDAPELDVDCEAVPPAGPVPLTVEFRAHPAGCVGPCEWRWELGDGAVVEGVRDPAHTYREGGTFRAKVTLTDALSFTPEERNRAATCERPVLATMPSAPAPVLAGFAYVANEDSNTVSAYGIVASSGVLLDAPGSPFAAGSRPVSVAVDSAGRFVYAANSGSGDVSAYTVGSGTGDLRAAPGSPFPVGASPRGLTVHPNSRWLYVAHSNGISAFAIDPASGALTLVPGSPFAAGSPQSIAVDRSGRFAYSANTDPATAGVSAFRIDGVSGTLAALPGAAFAAGSRPRTLGLDPLARFLYAPRFPDNAIPAFTIDATTGALAVVPGPLASASNSRPWSWIPPDTSPMQGVATASSTGWCASRSTRRRAASRGSRSRRSRASPPAPSPSIRAGASPSSAPRDSRRTRWAASPPTPSTRRRARWSSSRTRASRPPAPARSRPRRCGVDERRALQAASPAPARGGGGRLGAGGVSWRRERTVTTFVADTHALVWHLIWD